MRLLLALPWLCIGCSFWLDTDALSSGAGNGGNGGTTSTPENCSQDPCDGLDRSCQATLNEANCPVGCDGVVLSGRSYMGCSEGASFSDAEALCQAQGMHLVRVDDAAENARVVELARTLGSYVWLGGSDLDALGSYAWQDGSAFFRDDAAVSGVYVNFGSGQPVADVGRHCVQLHDVPEGDWSNAACSDIKPYICEP